MKCCFVREWLFCKQLFCNVQLHTNGKYIIHYFIKNISESQSIDKLSNSIILIFNFCNQTQSLKKFQFVYFLSNFLRFNFQAIYIHWRYNTKMQLILSANARIRILKNATIFMALWKILFLMNKLPIYFSRLFELFLLQCFVLCMDMYQLNCLIKSKRPLHVWWWVCFHSFVYNPFNYLPVWLDCKE